MDSQIHFSMAAIWQTMCIYLHLLHSVWLALGIFMPWEFYYGFSTPSLYGCDLTGHAYRIGIMDTCVLTICMYAFSNAFSHFLQVLFACIFGTIWLNSSCMYKIWTWIVYLSFDSILKYFSCDWINSFHDIVAALIGIVCHSLIPFWSIFPTIE